MVVGKVAQLVEKTAARTVGHSAVHLVAMLVENSAEKKAE